MLVIAATLTFTTYVPSSLRLGVFPWRRPLKLSTGPHTAARPRPENRSESAAALTILAIGDLVGRQAARWLERALLHLEMEPRCAA